MALLEGRFEPMTFNIGFLKAPYRVAVESFVSWRRETREKVETRELKGALPVLLKALEPLTMPPCRDLLVATRGPWVALFDNSARVSELSSPIGYMASRIKCTGVVASCIPDTIRASKRSRGTYGAVVFELFAPEQREFLNYERSVAAANDGGRWTFVAQGTTQPFEEVDAYKNREIRKRFTQEMLSRYCQAMGISVFSEEFYGTDGLLLESIGSAEAIAARVSMSLKEARHEHGLE